MKTFKSKFFTLALLVAGTIVGLTSCDKDPEGGGGDGFTSENVEGVYMGNHKLNIPANILGALSATLPPDTLDLEAPYDSIVATDLTKGFDDTLTVRVEGGIVKVTSALLDITVDGALTANNTVKIEEKKYDVLNLGSAVKAEDAALGTNKDVKFNSAAIGSVTSIELRLKANKIGTFTIPLNITTSGNFTKTAN